MRFKECHLVALHKLIDKLFLNYCSLFPNTALKPKAHYLSHYPVHIRKVGASVKTLRFESKHSCFKNSIAGSRKHMNVCKSMDEHHQALTYLHYKEDDYFQTGDFLLIEAREKIVLHLPEIYQNIFEEQYLSLEECIIEARDVKIGSTRYSSGHAVVLSISNDALWFEEIIKLLVVNSLVYLVKIFWWRILILIFQMVVMNSS